MARRRVHARANFAGCQAVHRADGAAARWGHRALPQRDRTTGHGRCVRPELSMGRVRILHGMPSRAPQWRAATRGGAMRTSRPTAKPHEGGCAARGTAGTSTGGTPEPREWNGASREGGEAPRAVATRWGHRALPQRDRTTGQELCAGEFRVGNAPWVMRVGNGGAIMTSRRVRGPATHRAADRATAFKTLSVCYLPSRAPRRWRGGAMGTSRPTAPRGTGGAHGDGARGVRDAKPRTAVASPTGGGGAMGTSRPTATRHDYGTRPRGAGEARRERTARGRRGVTARRL